MRIAIVRKDTPSQRQWPVNFGLRPEDRCRGRPQENSRATRERVSPGYMPPRPPVGTGRCSCPRFGTNLSSGCVELAHGIKAYSEISGRGSQRCPTQTPPFWSWTMIPTFVRPSDACCGRSESTLSSLRPFHCLSAAAYRR
jgi:hypothetical protein